MAAQGKVGLGQGLVFAAGGSKASHHPHLSDGRQEAEAFIPAQAVAPAAIRQAR